jgi:hypothetical protein
VLAHVGNKGRSSLPAIDTRPERWIECDTALEHDGCRGRMGVATGIQERLIDTIELALASRKGKWPKRARVIETRAERADVAERCPDRERFGQHTFALQQLEHRSRATADQLFPSVFFYRNAGIDQGLDALGASLSLLMRRCIEEKG